MSFFNIHSFNQLFLGHKNLAKTIIIFFAKQHCIYNKEKYNKFLISYNKKKAIFFYFYFSLFYFIRIREKN